MPGIVVFVDKTSARSASRGVLTLLHRLCLCLRFRFRYRIRLRLQRGCVFGRYPHERLGELRSFVTRLGFREFRCKQSVC